MLKIDKTGLNVPLTIKRQVSSTKKRIQNAGYSDIKTATNKKGDVVILAYTTPKQNELALSSTINPDGKQTLTFYRTQKEDGDNIVYPRRIRTIEKWDLVNNNLIFNKHTRIQYNGYSMVPEIISTMYTDKDSCDGVKIVKKYPYLEYSKRFQKHQE